MFKPLTFSLVQPQAEDKLELTPQVWKQLHAMVDDECYKAKGAAAHGTTVCRGLHI